MLKIRKMMKRQKGFTLVELIVVIAILGILAALAVPRIIGVISDAGTNSDNANLEIIKNALERYYIDNNDKYPATDNLAELETGNENGGPWLDKLPEETMKNGSYSYSSTGDTYELKYTPNEE